MFTRTKTLALSFVAVAALLLGVYFMLLSSSYRNIPIGLLLIAFSISLVFALLFSLYRLCCLIVTLNFSDPDLRKSIFINGKEYHLKGVDQKSFCFFRSGEYDVLVKDVKTDSTEVHSVRLYPGETVSVVIPGKP